MKGHFRGGTCARPGGRKRTSYLRQANVRTQRTRRTNAFLVARGDKTAMGLLAKLLWTLVRLNNASQTSAMGRLNVRPMLLTCRHNCWLRTGCEERVLDGRRPDGAQRWAVDETESDGVTSAWSKTFDELLVQCRVGRVHRQTNASPVQPTTNLYQTHTLWTLAPSSVDYSDMIYHTVQELRTARQNTAIDHSRLRSRCALRGRRLVMPNNSTKHNVVWLIPPHLPHYVKTWRHP